MAGSRTWVPPMPSSWVTAWQQSYLRRRGRGGSILQPAAGMLTAEDRRQLRFGPSWGWWGVPEAERVLWWERDGHPTAD